MNQKDYQLDEDGLTVAHYIALIKANNYNAQSNWMPTMNYPSTESNRWSDNPHAVGRKFGIIARPEPGPQSDGDIIMGTDSIHSHQMVPLNGPVALHSSFIPLQAASNAMPRFVHNMAPPSQRMTPLSNAQSLPHLSTRYQVPVQPQHQRANDLQMQINLATPIQSAAQSQTQVQLQQQQVRMLPELGNFVPPQQSQSFIHPLNQGITAMPLQLPVQSQNLIMTHNITAQHLQAPSTPQLQQANRLQGPLPVSLAGPTSQPHEFVQNTQGVTASLQPQQGPAMQQQPQLQNASQLQQDAMSLEAPTHINTQPQHRPLPHTMTMAHTMSPAHLPSNRILPLGTQISPVPTMNHGPVPSTYVPGRIVANMPMVPPTTLGYPYTPTATPQPMTHGPLPTADTPNYHLDFLSQKMPMYAAPQPLVPFNPMEALEELIVHHKDAINVRSEFGETPLLILCKSSATVHTKYMNAQLLLKYGADVNLAVRISNEINVCRHKLIVTRHRTTTDGLHFTQHFTRQTIHWHNCCSSTERISMLKTRLESRQWWLGCTDTTHIIMEIAATCTRKHWPCFNKKALTSRWPTRYVCTLRMYSTKIFSALQAIFGPFTCLRGFTRLARLGAEKHRVSCCARGKVVSWSLS